MDRNAADSVASRVNGKIEGLFFNNSSKTLKVRQPYFKMNLQFFGGKSGKGPSETRVVVKQVELIGEQSMVKEM